jgi:hypothetical protein
MDFIMRGILPFLNIFIIFFISLYCLMTRFTSVTLVIRIAPLRGGHGVDDCLHLHELPLIHVYALQFVHPGDHAQDVLEGSHASQFPELFLEVIEGEAVSHETFLELPGLLCLIGLLRLFDKAQYVAHPQDAIRHAVGMELLQHFDLLAGADVLDGHARHRGDGERGSSPGIAVHLREDDAVDAH